MALARYCRVIQDKFTHNDTTWSYLVPDLPDSFICNQNGYVKSCAAVSKPTEQSLTLSLLRISSNRAISSQQLSAFIHISFEDFRLQTPDNDQAPFRESADYVAKLLKSGIRMNGVHYHFYGHSNSQLKSRSCFLMAGSRDAVHRVVDGFGDFSKMKTVAKKAKRIGLLFSTAHVIMTVDQTRVRDIEDIENHDFIFTDGCGLISPNLANMLARKRPINFRNRRHHPSVLQIRYRGYKGVVTLEPNMTPGTWLELRKSMKKFSGGDDLGFAVVEYSKVCQSAESYLQSV